MIFSSSSIFGVVVVPDRSFMIIFLIWKVCHFIIDKKLFSITDSGVDDVNLKGPVISQNGLGPDMDAVDQNQNSLETMESGIGEPFFDMRFSFSLSFFLSHFLSFFHPCFLAFLFSSLDMAYCFCLCHMYK